MSEPSFQPNAQEGEAVHQDIFILRFWYEQNEPPIWRISVTDVSQQQKVYFASLQDLNAFFRVRLEIETGQPKTKIRTDP